MRYKTGLSILELLRKILEPVLAVGLDISFFFDCSNVVEAAIS